MGPTLAVLAKRAAEEAGHSLEVIAVSRFKNEESRRWLEERGVKTLGADLMDPDSVGELPASQNVIYLVGLKFGTAQNPEATWAINTIAPANVIRKYRDARIVALSTGNVYPFSPAEKRGSLEEDPLIPLGEYPNAAVARERIFQYYAKTLGSQVALLRLFYAVELRYGVVADMASKILAGEAIDLRNGMFNCIWQGDANDMILRAFRLTENPPSVWNLCRPECFSVREVATELGELLGIAPLFRETDSGTALLGNSRRICKALGEPRISMGRILKWTADWQLIGGKSLNKPTHFETRDGNY